METIKRGSKGEAVRLLQSALHLAVDGVFGRITDEAVRAFQRKNNLKADGVVGSATWAKLLDADGLVLPYLKTANRKIKEIIVHCSATREGRDFTIDDIRRWHKQRGYSDIGYHYVVYRDGSVHDGRDVNIIGAHCVGHNTYSIGICYIGGCKYDGLTPKDTRTEKQKAALKTLIMRLKAKYPYASVRGHRDFANKACPSFDATQEYKNV